jgi:hypothetical protein
MGHAGYNCCLITSDFSMLGLASTLLCPSSGSRRQQSVENYKSNRNPRESLSWSKMMSL